MSSAYSKSGVLTLSLLLFLSDYHLGRVAMVFRARRLVCGSVAGLSATGGTGDG